MRTLFWKMFLPILIAMVVLILASVLLVASSAQQKRHQLYESVIALYLEAQSELNEGGEEALTQWLKRNVDDISGVNVFIAERGQRIDILGRQLPPRNEMLERFRERRDSREPRKGRRERFVNDNEQYPNLVTSTGETYRFHLARAPATIANLIRNESIFWPLILSMIGLSALVAYLIARHISKPIQRLRLGAQRIAQGHLKERVAPDFKNRKDEIGDLAEDFDAMSEHVSQLLLSQRRMLRDVSHELRSPLARMQVALGLAEKRSGDKIKPELARIETEANTLNQMIGKILSLVRLQNMSINQSELKWEEGDLVEVLKDLVQNANYEAQNKNVVIELTGLTSAPFNMVTELLRSALENIIRNAVQYTKPDTRVNVSLLEKNGKYQMSIRDHGDGVPTESLDKLFEPFYRVSNVREHNQGTGGIGLAIAKRAMELHGGRIWAENMKPGLQVNIQI